MIFRPDLLEDLVQRLEIEPLPRHERRAGVFLKDGGEPAGVALRVVDPLRGVPFGPADRLLGDARGLGNLVVVLGPGLVDLPLLFLEGFVDLVEGRLDRLGRIDILKDELADLDPDLVSVAEILEKVFRLVGQPVSSRRQDLVHGVVPDDAPDDGLVHVAERRFRLAHLEEILVRVLDLVLDDPLDVQDVQVAGEHDRFLLGVGGDGELGVDAGCRRPEAELVLELALDGNARQSLDAEGEFEVEARVGRPDEPPEPQDDAHFVGPDLVKRSVENDDRHDRDDGRPDVLPRNLRDLEFHLRKILIHTTSCLVEIPPVLGGGNISDVVWPAITSSGVRCRNDIITESISCPRF